jgi:hypothetical protein
MQAVESRMLKTVFILFNLGFLCFLAYMSAIIGAVFTQHVDASTGTVTDAMTALHIDAHTFVFQRASLATLLLILMAVDRTLERWRMRQIATFVEPDQATMVTPAAAAPDSQVAPSAQVVQQTDMEKLIQAMQTMNAQTLQTIQAMNQQAMQVTIEQATRVTVEAVRESLEGFTNPLQIEAPKDGNPLQANSNTDSVVADGKPVGGLPIPDSYEDKIQALYEENPHIDYQEVMQKTGCSKPTAMKWLSRLQQPSDDKLELTLQFLNEHPEYTNHAPGGLDDIDSKLANHLGLKRPASARFWRLKALEMLDASKQ